MIIIVFFRTFAVDHNESWEVFNIDLPHRFHAQLGVLQDFHLREILAGGGERGTQTTVGGFAHSLDLPVDYLLLR